MDPKLGQQTDALTFLNALASEPYRYDFYQTLRRLECVYRDQPRLGTARRPIEEAIRFGQDADLAFAPASLASFTLGTGTKPSRLQVRLFGLLGPDGPMPIHFTEYVRQRAAVHDLTLSRFLDLIHHRFLELFYRAWAQAQPHVSRDRPRRDRYAAYVGSFIGVSTPPLLGRDSVPDEARLFHAGTLIRQVRSAEGLTSILHQFFSIPVQIEEFVGHWLRLAPQERTRLGRDSVPLGAGAVLGSRVWDHQCKFRIHLGPLSLAQFEAFLPATPSPSQGPARSGRLLRKLVDWVRFYLCFELDWDVRLRLKHDEVPRTELGRQGQLGWTTWLGRRRSLTDAGDLCLDAERFVGRDRLA
jgi:type VI secretion system protein ImpH